MSRRSPAALASTGLGLASALALLLSLGLAPSATAQPADECSVGPSLAATLLVPYFEVDLDDPAGTTTLISINNGVSGRILARMVVWSDFGIPVLAFDIFLDDFDVVPINMRDIMLGNVPLTGLGADLGGLSGCDSTPPPTQNPIFDATTRQQLQGDLTGVQGPLFTTCAGSFYGDRIARGYVTVDVVSSCSGTEALNPSTTPASGGYFADGGSGLARNDNVLWGDVIYVDPSNASAQGSEAIAVWAGADDFDGVNIHTFYGRFHGWDGRDDRVPMPSQWNQRFFDGGPFAGGADLLVYRDPGFEVDFAECGGVPDGFLLDATITALDEDGGSVVDVSAGAPLGLATQRVPVGSLNIPYEFGWTQIGTDFGSWVQPTLSADGLYSASFNGIPTDFLCDDDPLPVLQGPPPVKVRYDLRR